MSIGETTVVEAVALVKEFQKGTRVLDSLDFSIREGEVVALVGANGAGKSTFIKILLGLVKASSGSVRIFGKSPTEVGALEKVGYLPEVPGFWSEFSAKELLEEIGGLRKIPKAQVLKRGERLLGLLGLKLRGTRRMGGYSKGMLQRSGVAATLLHDPDFIILDEPMSGLDPRAQEKLRSILLKLKGAGKTMLISSHSLDDIRTLCDRVLVLEKSKLVMNGPTTQVLQALVEKYRSSEPWDEDPLGEVPESWSLDG